MGFGVIKVGNQKRSPHWWYRQCRESRQYWQCRQWPICNCRTYLPDLPTWHYNRDRARAVSQLLQCFLFWLLPSPSPHPHPGWLEKAPPWQQGFTLCDRACHRVPSPTAGSKYPPLCCPWTGWRKQLFKRWRFHWDILNTGSRMVYFISKNVNIVTVIIPEIFTFSSSQSNRHLLDAVPLDQRAGFLCRPPCIFLLLCLHEFCQVRENVKQRWKGEFL